MEIDPFDCNHEFDMLPSFYHDQMDCRQPSPNRNLGNLLSRIDSYEEDEGDVFDKLFDSRDEEKIVDLLQSGTVNWNCGFCGVHSSYYLYTAIINNMHSVASWMIEHPLTDVNAPVRMTADDEEEEEEEHIPLILGLYEALFTEKRCKRAINPMWWILVARLCMERPDLNLDVSYSGRTLLGLAIEARDAHMCRILIGSGKPLGELNYTDRELRRLPGQMKQLLLVCAIGRAPHITLFYRALVINFLKRCVLQSREKKKQ